jgi:glycine cleavage system H lipoate-binding protein
VNQDPYGAGWIVVVKPSRLDDELNDLLSHADYAKFIEELVKKK